MRWLWERKKQTRGRGFQPKMMQATDLSGGGEKDAFGLDVHWASSANWKRAPGPRGLPVRNTGWEVTLRQLRVSPRRAEVGGNRKGKEEGEETTRRERTVREAQGRSLWKRRRGTERAGCRVLFGWLRKATESALEGEVPVPWIGGEDWNSLRVQTEGREGWLADVPSPEISGEEQVSSFDSR